MRYVIAAFRAESEAVDLLFLLKKANTEARLLSTPQAARVGCGICVSINEESLYLAKEIIEQGKFVSYAGLFCVVESKNGLIVTRL